MCVCLVCVFCLRVCVSVCVLESLRCVSFYVCRVCVCLSLPLFCSYDRCLFQFASRAGARAVSLFLSCSLSLSLSRAPSLPLARSKRACVACGSGAAFFGDKILGVHVVRAQSDQCSLNLGLLTTVYGLAVSNDFFAEHLRVILPLQVDEALGSLATRQKHDAGSMVEAAVAAVDKLHQDAKDKPTNSPILNLARWLVTVARTRLESDYNINAKGLLLEQGGRVDATLLPGFPDHAPQFCAVATLGDSRCEATGSNIKDSQQDAARMLLANLGILSSEITARKRISATIPPTSTHAWMPYNTQKFLGAKLKNDESLYEWWLRKTTDGCTISKAKKDAFHRMTMSVVCLPFVAQVDTWCSDTHTHVNTSSAEVPAVEALVAVKLRLRHDGDSLLPGPLHVETFTASGTSNTNARALVALKVNAFFLDRLATENNQLLKNTL